MRDGGRFGAVPDAELREHARDVVVDGSAADEQLRGDLGVRQTLTDAHHHLALPCGEQTEPARTVPFAVDGIVVSLEPGPGNVGVGHRTEGLERLEGEPGLRSGEIRLVRVNDPGEHEPGPCSFEHQIHPHESIEC